MVRKLDSTTPLLTNTLRSHAQHPRINQRSISIMHLFEGIPPVEYCKNSMEIKYNKLQTTCQPNDDLAGDLPEKFPKDPITFRSLLLKITSCFPFHKKASPPDDSLTLSVGLNSTSDEESISNSKMESEQDLMNEASPQ